MASNSTSTSFYDSWSREQLIARLHHLDPQPSQSLPSPPSVTLPSARNGNGKPKTKAPKPFDFSSYPTRKIALKFAYAGSHYNGLAFQSTPTPLPTVEGVLFDALADTKLIDQCKGFEGCGWERCGRTDRGVSSAGQVVSLWVRSQLGPRKDEKGDENSASSTVDTTTPADSTHTVTDEDSSVEANPPPQPARELRYVQILNRVLPPTIRVLAWSTVSPTFSARFSCASRHYKYYFSTTGVDGKKVLDVERMQEAARRLVGEHDFRNLCKVDPSKQITSYRRKILSAEISPVSVLDGTGFGSEKDRMFVFDLKGTAFLYNQVRHIMALLFLVGSGLEHPSVITSLLNSDPSQPESPHSEGEGEPEFVDRKPEYQMANALPLVLYSCNYRVEDVQWVVEPPLPSEFSPANQVIANPFSQRLGAGDPNLQLVHIGHEIAGWDASRSVYSPFAQAHQEFLTQAALYSSFLSSASQHHSLPPSPMPIPPELTSINSRGAMFRAQNTDEYLDIPLGGGQTRRSRASFYVPLLRRKRLEHVDVVNERWKLGKGARAKERKSGEEHGMLPAQSRSNIEDEQEGTNQL